MESNLSRGGARPVGLGAALVFVELAVALAVATALWLWGGVPASAAVLLPVPALAAAGVTVLALYRGVQLPLLPIGLALNLLGLAVLAVVAPSFYQLQAGWSLLAIMVYAALGLRRRRPGLLRRFHLPLYLLALALVVATFVVGTNPSGAGPKQWLAVGPYYFQPSELLKLGLIALLAYQLDGRVLASLPLAATALGALLVAAQGDLGATLVFTGIAALMYYGASGRWQPFAAGAALLGAFGAAAYRLVPRVSDRFGAWLNPWRDPLGSSYQVLQGLRAIAAGGVLGRGLFAAESVHVPALHTDMIAAAIAERLGLLGSLTVLALYGLLLWQIAAPSRQPDSEARERFRLGVAALLVGQAVLILAGATALLPLTGVTLPFVSYGGSSLLVSYLALGLLETNDERAPECNHAAGAERSHRRIVYWGLAAALGILTAWLIAWHLFGDAILQVGPAA